MRALLRVFAAAVLAAGLLLWLTGGANRGWTKTSVPVTRLDEVTGIEAIEYQKRFVPGLDFLAITLLGAVAFAGASFFCRNRQQRIVSEI